MTESILLKIRKCLALSRSSNVHEAAIALKQAQALMQKHNLDHEALRTVEDVSEAWVEGVAKKHTGWETLLAKLVANAFGCKVLVWDSRWLYVGEGGAESAIFAFEVLLRQVRYARGEYIKTKLTRCNRASKTRRGDMFCLAWVIEVEKMVVAFAQSDEQKARIDAYIALHIEVEETKAKLTNRRNRKTNVLSAEESRDYRAGLVEGKKAYLNRGVHGESQNNQLMVTPGLEWSNQQGAEV